MPCQNIVILKNIDSALIIFFFFIVIIILKIPSLKTKDVAFCLPNVNSNFTIKMIPFQEDYLTFFYFTGFFLLGGVLG